MKLNAGGRKFRIAMWSMLLAEINLAVGLITPGVWQVVMLGIIGLYGLANVGTRVADALRRPSENVGEVPRGVR